MPVAGLADDIYIYILRWTFDRADTLAQQPIGAVTVFASCVFYAHVFETYARVGMCFQLGGINMHSGRAA